MTRSRPGFDRGAGGRALSISGRVLLAFYVVAGLAAMWLLAPRVPYADAWRHLARFVVEPFPADVVTPDNGHHELLPNVVRVLELHLFGGGQGLQVLAGIALVLATLLVYWRGIRDLDEPPKRLGGLLAVVLGLFWLGNVRALAHGNESVHAYSVTLFLALGMHALVRARGPAGGALLAALCGVGASFSFGSGFGCFAAFALVMALRGAGWRSWSILAGGALLTLLLLQMAGGTGSGLRLAPFQQLPMLLAWLSGPLLYAAWPLLDSQVAAQLPLEAVRAPVSVLAAAYETGAGRAVEGPWPQVLAGALGLAWFLLLLWRAKKARDTAMLAGLGTAGFALAAGAMIVLVRLDYFVTNPDQLLAPRYVVWSSLFWGGLLLATVAGARHGTRALAGVVLAALLVLPSQAWMGMLGARMAQVAEQSALAAAAGVVEPDLELGETVFEELALARPLLREAGVSVFAWPEAAWLGRSWPAEAPRELPPDRVEVTAVANRLGSEGRRLRFELEATCARLLLLDVDGQVAGLAMPDGSGAWLGWMQESGSLPSQPAACVPAG